MITQRRLNRTPRQQQPINRRFLHSRQANLFNILNSSTNRPITILNVRILRTRRILISILSIHIRRRHHPAQRSNNRIPTSQARSRHVAANRMLATIVTSSFSSRHNSAITRTTALTSRTTNRSTPINHTMNSRITNSSLLINNRLHTLIKPSSRNPTKRPLTRMIINIPIRARNSPLKRRYPRALPN